MFEHKNRGFKTKIENLLRTENAHNFAMSQYDRQV